MTSRRRRISHETSRTTVDQTHLFIRLDIGCQPLLQLFVQSRHLLNGAFFFAATLATFRSSRRASARVLRTPGFNNRMSSSGSDTSRSSTRAPRGADPRGVDQPLLLPKSTRIKRTVSAVKATRQKGQDGVRREDVLSIMLLQQ